MKRLVKRLVRPFVRRFDAKLNEMIAAAVRAQLLPPIEASSRTLERLEASLGAANHSANAMASDIDLMLGSVVREVARLQSQVDDVRDLLERVGPSRAGLTLVERDEGESVGWSSGGERSMVG